MSDVYEGSCFCGEVEVKVQGPPLAAGYCHCASCQRVHGAPFITWGAWKETDVTITKGETQTREFNRTGNEEHSSRFFCETCGGRVGNRRRHTKTAIVYGSTLRDTDIAFVPQMHIHYRDRSMDVADGLPKFLDTPGKWGGSDEQAEEPSTTGWRKG